MELDKVLEFTKDAIRKNLVKWAYKDELVLLEALEKIEAYQNQPPNKVNATDKKPLCSFCKVLNRLHDYNNYCGSCGRAFDR